MFSFIIHFTTPSVSTLNNVEWQDDHEWQIEKDLEGIGCGWTGTVSQRLLEVGEGIHEIFDQENCVPVENQG
jgi:uncharacterized protein YqkB